MSKKEKDELMDGVADVLSNNPNVPPDAALNPDTASASEQQQTAVQPDVYPAHEQHQPELVQPELIRQPVYPQQPPQRNNSGSPAPQRKKTNPANQKKKRKKKKKKSRLPGIIILTTFIFGVSVILSMVIIGYGKDMFGIGKSDKTHLIVIPENATTEEIANMLESDGIIESQKFFTLFTRLRKSEDTYIPGEHFIRPNMAYETIIDKLTKIEEEETGDTVEVTFPEGITIMDAARILEQENICSYDDFIFYFNSGGYGYEFEDRLPNDSSLKFMRMEGYLFPDTYFFTTGMDAEQVCQKIYMNFNEKMTDERYARMEELGLTLDQLITFSSIVQKEAANTNTMTLVASVFWNRLNNSDVFPLLQSDPTSNYADLVRANMEVVDMTLVESYDTYKSAGLPPGAICNPGLEAIDAVLTAFKSDYLYFIANINTGQTYFSATLEEHEANEEMINEQYREEKAAADAAEAGNAE